MLSFNNVHSKDIYGKPKIVDGKAVPVDGVLHRFTYVLDEG